jgi:hypothetical protein
VIQSGYKIEFSSRKQLDRQKKKEKRASPAISDHLSKKQTVGWDRISRVKLSKGERPVGLEPTTSYLEGTQYKTLSAATGVAYEGTRHLSPP